MILFYPLTIAAGSPLDRTVGAALCYSPCHAFSSCSRSSASRNRRVPLRGRERGWPLWFVGYAFVHNRRRVGC